MSTIDVNNEVANIESRIRLGTFETDDFKVDLFAPDLWFLLRFILIILSTVAVGNALSLVVYYGIIRNRRSPFLVAFGVVLPILFWTPFWLVDYFDIRSSALRLSLLSQPMTGGLRTLQALASGSTAKSWNEYRHQFGFILHPKLDPQTNALIPVSGRSFLMCLGNYLFWFTMVGLALSYLLPRSFAPWETQRSATEVYVSLDPPHLANNFVQAVITSWQLSVSLDSGVNALLQLLTGVQFERVVDSPMFGSQSPSDFWGRRWNMLIHRDLKFSVYRPVRYWSKSKHLATLATFLMSGLVHEYVSLFIFHANKHQDESQLHIPGFGKHMLFFGWNGLLILFEFYVGRDAWQKWAKSMFPAFTTLLVILMALPVGHLFTGDFVEGNFFDDVALIVPFLRVQQKG